MWIRPLNGELSHANTDGCNVKALVTSMLGMIIVMTLGMAGNSDAFVPNPSFTSRSYRPGTQCGVRIQQQASRERTKFNLDDDLPESTYTPLMQADCSQVATEVRKVYDALFNDPREPNGRRFIFDPWYVTCGDQGTKKKVYEINAGTKSNGAATAEGSTEDSASAAEKQVQYSLKRAQLSQLLDNDALYSALVNKLTELGMSVGCTCITPPWISLYVDGDRQNFHSDAANGPLAYVLSITSNDDYGLHFQGGETMMVQPKILDYWRDYDESVGLETPSILEFHPPIFGRCIAFDPRVPHGVTEVRGTRDPRHGRVVIHGWFSEPETVFIGDMFDTNESLKLDTLRQLDSLMEPLIDSLGGGDIGRVMGYLAVKVEIGSQGRVESLTSVCDTLIADPEDSRGVIGEDMEGREVIEDPVSDVKLTVNENLKLLQVPEQAAGGIIIVPFMFS